MTGTLPFSTRDLLEMCRSLIRAQIKERQINSIEELHAFERHLTEELSALTAGGDDG